MRRTAWQFVVAVTLLLLLTILGTLQYRWLGEVSNAERDRLRASLRTRAADLVDDFDREISRTYRAFHVDSEMFDKDPAGTLADAYARAQAASIVGGLVKTVFLVDARTEHARLEQLEPARRQLIPIAWPDALAKWRGAADQLPATARGALSPLLVADPIDPELPALVVPIPILKRIDREAHIATLPDPAGPTRGIIVWLDADRVRRQLLDTLVTRHFGSADASEYFVNVVSRHDPSQLIYTSGRRDDVSASNADFAAGLFSLRFDDLTFFNLHVPPPPSDGAERKNSVAITIVRRTNGPDGLRVLMAGSDPQGAWELLMRCKSGSLEALVAQSRRRNMAVGLGVLGLLAVSFVFVIGSAQRQQKLARQQMEFVAAVSHELRTPLAVIQSAGENLADGVVADADQVRRYGSLIRTEGRRLTDMVERVLEFAGLSSGTTSRASGDVDVRNVIDDAVAALAVDARDRDIAVNVTGRGSLPIVQGDAAALRSAVQNILGNAIKYSPSGSAVGVDATSDAGAVRITVSDQGLGIDAADLPHVFKPFFRGRRAVDAQLRGTGVGLSVVRHVVDAHGGHVRINSAAGVGTVVTLTLPITAGESSVVAQPRTAT